MKKKLEKDERIIYEDKKIYLTNRNLIINHKKLFKEKIMLGDIRERELEKNKINVSIMKRAKLKKITLEIPLDEIEDIFKKLKESVKECKAIEYRKTTSWYWEDLVEEDYQLINYSYQGLKIFGFFLTLFSTFLFITGFLSILKNYLEWKAWGIFLFGYYITWSYPLYLIDKIIFSGDNVVHRYFLTLKYRRYSFKKMIREAEEPWIVRYGPFDSKNSKSVVFIKGSLFGSSISVIMSKKTKLSDFNLMSFPHGFYGIYWKCAKQCEEITKKIFLREE